MHTLGTWFILLGRTQFILFQNLFYCLRKKITELVLEHTSAWQVGGGRSVVQDGVTVMVEGKSTDGLIN